jgi:hypothetical protein
MTRRTLRRIVWAAVALGLICIAPTVYVKASDKERQSLSPEEAFLALEPVARIPLDTIWAAGAMSTVFQVQPSRTWEAWGTPFYTVLARAERTNGWWIIPFNSLGIDIKVNAYEQLVAVNEATHFPYGYSSETHDIGRSFSVKPGNVKVDFVARRREYMRGGELVVTPDWNIAIKDKLVATTLHHDLFRLMRYLSWVGLVFLSVGVIGLFAVSGRSA